MNQNLEEYLLAIQSLFPRDLKLIEEVRKKIETGERDDLIENPLKRRRISIFYEKEKENLREILLKNSIKTVSILSEDYPEKLKQSYAPPLVLFYKGDISILREPTISIVGTRKPTSYGIKNAEVFSCFLSERGFIVVSGMANGIDAHVHGGALKGGKTVGVLGSNLVDIYPARNRRLAKEISEKGCLISEFSPLTRTHPSNFPIRNRIIAALSLFTLVIEARERSGSLITAMLALESGRDVGAIPGNIDSENSKGTNRLIKNGAILINSPEDIIELPYYKEKIRFRENKVSLTKKEEDVLSVIPKDKFISLDEILEKTGLDFGELFNILLQLRFKNLIMEFTGKNYQRTI